MARQHISEGLKRFITEQIHSVFRLEILLLLHRTQSRFFTAAEVVQELCFEADVAQEQLSELVEIGLLAQSETDDLTTVTILLIKRKGPWSMNWRWLLYAASSNPKPDSRKTSR